MLDRGDVVKGWTRTGLRFNAFTQADPSAGTSPVLPVLGTPEQRARHGTSTPATRASARRCAAIRPGPSKGSPSTSACPPAATASRARRRSGGAFTRAPWNSTINHRFLPADAAPADGRDLHPRGRGDVRAAVRRADRGGRRSAARAGDVGADVGPKSPRVRQIGAAAFVEQQLALPPSPYPSYAAVPQTRPATCVDDATPPVRPDSYAPARQLQRCSSCSANSSACAARARPAAAAGRLRALADPGHLRHDIGLAYAMREYQQLLRDLAFGNYEASSPR